MSSDLNSAPFKTVEQYISENFPYVDKQSMLWYHLDPKILGLDSAEYIDKINLAVGRCYCKCDLRTHYWCPEFSSMHRGYLIGLVKPGIASKGICPVHPGRYMHDYCCDKHKPDNQSQPSTSSKGARRREQRKRAKARKMINENNAVTNELSC
jgi:hypothetical protein